MRPSTAIDRSAAISALPSVTRAELEERFNRLLEANTAALSRLAASYASHVAERDDLLQDIALALWRALPRFRGECSERTFLFRIAHNRCISSLSKRRLSVPLDPLDTNVADSPDPSPGTDARLSEEQQSQRLFEAIRQLPVVYRQVIVLALEGLAYREIAEILGIGEGNVGARLSRARQILKQVLKERT